MSIMQMMLGASGGAYDGINATGGDSAVETVIDGDKYMVHTFLSDGNFIVTKEGEYDAIIVGGGGGGKFYGGGGGGGAVIHVEDKTIGTGATEGSPITYAIVIGDGGAFNGQFDPDLPSSATYYRTCPTAGTHNGESTTFDGYTSTGGGAGGGYDYCTALAGANAGGDASILNIRTGTTGVAPTGDSKTTVYAGNSSNGGDKSEYYERTFSGGAGAGGDALQTTDISIAGFANGGPGIQINIDGNNYYWGGGGGGYCEYNNGSYTAGNGTTYGPFAKGCQGGIGGGGAGHTYSSQWDECDGGGSAINSGSDADAYRSGDGGANTGGGGGALSWPASDGNGARPGAGGSGIVIIRYRI